MLQRCQKKRNELGHIIFTEFDSLYKNNQFLGNSRLSKIMKYFGFIYVNQTIYLIIVVICFFFFSGDLGTTPLVATAAMPSSSLKIYRGEPVDGRVAESVKIGDPLTMVISIDNQNIYGMHISECYVRDGLGWSEQGLINDEG